MLRHVCRSHGPHCRLGWDQQLHSSVSVRLTADIRLSVFKLAPEEYYERPVRHNFHFRNDHHGEPDDDGFLSLPAESACFTNRDGDEDSDENGAAHELGEPETGAVRLSVGPLHRTAAAAPAHKEPEPAPLCSCTAQCLSVVLGPLPHVRLAPHHDRKREVHHRLRPRGTRPPPPPPRGGKPDAE